MANCLKDYDYSLTLRRNPRTLVRRASLTVANEKGFTFAEVILAAAILAFTLASLLALFVSCMLLNDASRNLTQAAGHAQFVMEDIRDTAFSNIAPKINSGDWDWDISAITGQGLSGLRSESIDAQASGSDPLDVIVTVSWQDRSGRDRQMELETLFSEQ